MLEDSQSEQFLLLCKLLVYPVKLLYANGEVASSVPIEVRAKLIPTWTKLIDAVAMVNRDSSSLMNEFVTMVINKLVEFFEEQEAEVGVAYILANQ